MYICICIHFIFNINEPQFTLRDCFSTITIIFGADQLSKVRNLSQLYSNFKESTKRLSLFSKKSSPRACKQALRTSRIIGIYCVLIYTCVMHVNEYTHIHVCVI